MGEGGAGTRDGAEVEKERVYFYRFSIRQRPFIMLAKAALAQRLTSPLGAARSLEYLYITKIDRTLNGGNSEVPMRFGLELRLPTRGFWGLRGTGSFKGARSLEHELRLSQWSPYP